jgi:hypothetical protein
MTDIKATQRAQFRPTEIFQITHASNASSTQVIASAIH